MKGLALLALLGSLPIAGCGTSRAITAENQVIEMPSYTLRVPPDRGWELDERQGEPTELVRIVRSEGDRHYLVTVARNIIVDPVRRGWASEAVARDYFAFERKEMAVKGVEAGKYELSGVTEDTVTVDGRRFFRMSYQTHGAGARVLSSMYLHFPEPEDNEAFYLLHLSEGVRPDLPHHPYWPAEVESIVAGFVPR
jgi:hypothetical protein